jgi:glycerol-3-phosphate acyltransferase PlsX
VSDSLVISIDAMGGDHGVAVTVPGMNRAAHKLKDRNIRFLVHGDEAQIKAALDKAPTARAVTDIRHTERVIAMDEKTAQAVRRGKGSSLFNAIESVKAGEAQAIVSGGNTGALMAISKLVLRMAADLDRPAIVVSWPTAKGVTAFLDAGANVECDAERLVEFAIMGAAFHRAVYKTERPRVGLLNVGSEDEKGHDEVKEAHRLLRETALDLDYRGFAEGDDIPKGDLDVIVTDGFTGNAVLKAGEGLARFFVSELRSALSADMRSKLGEALAAPGLRKLAERLRPPAGGPLLGLNGIVIKSHGGADFRGFADAIGVAADMAQSGYSEEIARNLKRLTAAVSVAEASAEENS